MKLRKTLLSLVLALALLLCLLPAALAAPKGFGRLVQGQEQEQQDAIAGDEAAVPEEYEAAQAEAVQEPEGEAPAADVAAEPITNGPEEICYIARGEAVYNNGGTVYNNGGVVYNNGGVVYNNDGLVYNNAGTVYSNGGTVYDNGGAVYSNGAQVFTHGGAVEESMVYGYYRLSLAGDYLDFVELQGLEAQPETEELLLSQETELRIVPREGFRILEAQADAGKLRADGEGAYLLSQVDGPVELSLVIQAQAPQFSLPAGTYAQAQTVELSAVEGAEIYYTLDGSAPAEDNSLLYQEPIPVEEGVIITAEAVVKGVQISEQVSAAYAVPRVSAPEFSVQEEGYKQPAPQGILIENPGLAEANIRSVELKDDESRAFILNRESSGSVKAGESESARWTVRPAARLAPGEYKAVLVVTFDSGESLELPLLFQVEETVSAQMPDQSASRDAIPRSAA